MVLSLNSETYPMKPSVKVSLITAAIAITGMGSIAQMGLALSLNPSLIAVTGQKVESRTYKGNSIYAKDSDDPFLRILVNRYLTGA